MDAQHYGTETTAAHLRRGVTVADDVTTWARVTESYPVTGDGLYQIAVVWELADGRRESGTYAPGDRFTVLPMSGQYAVTVAGVTSSRTVDHSGHMWEGWAAYVSADVLTDVPWVSGSDAGICCHTCRAIVIDRGDETRRAPVDTATGAAAAETAAAGWAAELTEPGKDRELCRVSGCERVATFHETAHPDLLDSRRCADHAGPEHTADTVRGDVAADDAVALCPVVYPFGTASDDRCPVCSRRVWAHHGADGDALRRATLPLLPPADVPVEYLTRVDYTRTADTLAAGEVIADTATYGHIRIGEVTSTDGRVHVSGRLVESDRERYPERAGLIRHTYRPSDRVTVYCLETGGEL